jgi:microcystin-dependent protein
MEVFVGTIMPVAFTYAPAGWLLCEGQLLQIQQYHLLYSVIGLSYGGDGVTTFALPDLRGRIAVGTTLATTAPTTVMAMRAGQVTGKATVTDPVPGVASVTIPAAALPAHTHQVAIPGSAFQASSVLHVSSSGGATTPNANTVLSSGGTGGGGQAFIYAPGATPEITLAPASVTTALADVSVASGSTGAASSTLAGAVNWTPSVGVVQPSLGITFIICAEGPYYPVRP